jgi:Protein of unknown function (DUF1493)
VFKLSRAAIVEGETVESGIAKRVTEFLVRELRLRKTDLKRETRLRQDLRVYGTDAIELLEAFAEEFRVDMSGFDVAQYFWPEGSDPIRWLWRLLVGDKLLTMTVEDLVRSAESGRWIHSNDTARRNVGKWSSDS